MKICTVTDCLTNFQVSICGQLVEKSRRLIDSDNLSCRHSKWNDIFIGLLVGPHLEFSVGLGQWPQDRDTGIYREFYPPVAKSQGPEGPMVRY
jgi:hypothetical protein